MSTVSVESEADIWLTEVTAPTVSVSCSIPGRTMSAEVDGGVRFYAGGRTRIISTPRDRRAYPLRLQDLKDADVELLLGWRGRMLLMRDVMGRRVFGTFLAIETSDFHEAAGMTYDVSIVFHELSYSEAV